MNRAKRSESWTPVLILVAACALAMVAYVVKYPEATRRLSRAVIGQPEEPAPAAAPEPDKQPAAAAPRKARARRTSPSDSAAGRRDASAAASNKAQPAAQAGSSHQTVATDSAALYSSNTRGGRVVHVLKKGESVETKLEIVDSRGRWRFVKTGDNQSGFVPSENLNGEKPSQAMKLTIVR